jgi:hypothetical protein
MTSTSLPLQSYTKNNIGELQATTSESSELSERQMNVHNKRVVNAVHVVDENATYIGYIDKYRQSVYVHFPIVGLATLVYSSFYTSTPSLYDWMKIIIFAVGSIYSILTSIYLFTIIGMWRSKIVDGIEKLRDNAIELAIKNYRLIKEYREVYHHHYGDILSRCTDRYNKGQIGQIKHNDTLDETNKDESIKEYVKFVLKNDVSERLESYEWIRASINRINKYIKLCYYLSFIKQTDEMEIKHNKKISLNIVSESVLNKRNRKLESILNEIPNHYKNELIYAKNNLDNIDSGSLVYIPCKWIVCEYRDIFRYLMCAKYFNKIYSSFDQDYMEIENTVNRLCTSIQKLFRREYVLPQPLIDLHSIISDCLIFTIDNFMALNLLNSFFTSGAIIVPILGSIIFHIILICAVSGIKDMITKTQKVIDQKDDLETMDKDIENIFNEMIVVLMDGVVKTK